MQRIIAVLAFAGGVSACQGVVESSAFLSHVNEIAGSPQCPSGGVLIRNGRDLDGDDTLGAEETTSQSEVCSGPAGRDGVNGAAGTNAPVPRFKTTMVGAGDANCAAGGVRIDFGYDAMVDGGTGDGILSDAEIESTRYACNGAAAVYPQSTTPPAGEVGHSSISAVGGDSVNGDAGWGGTVSVEMGGTLGGNIKLFSTGSVDAGFEVPAVPFEEGSNPLHVTSDLTLRNFKSVSAGLASGDEYFRASLTLMRRVNGQGVEVTSVDVAAGVTLTTSGLYYMGDVRNAGTIRGMPDSSDFATLNVMGRSFSGLPGSMLIAQSGSPALSGEIGVSGLSVVNQGRIVASGLDQPVGGAGGRIQLTGKICVNTGSIEARGGAGQHGGPGGSIAMSTGSLDGGGGSQVWNRGTFDASGGEGLIAGGAGGVIQLRSNSTVTFRNEGSLIARGGACHAGSAECTSGNGGRASLSAAGADLLSNASIDVSGGAGAVSAAGAAGGLISFSATDIEGVRRLGPIRVSGNLMANGAPGSPGGAAGSVTFDMLSGPDPRGEGIELLGYASILLNGGQSQRGIGGNGGRLVARMRASERAEVEIGPTGAIVSNLNVTAKGGDGWVGGSGGSFGLQGPGEWSHIISELEFIKSSGWADLHGGAGQASCGLGGGASFYGRAEIDVNGRLNLAGGSLAEAANGGSGGSLNISSLSRLRLRAEVIATGGSGQRAGFGGNLWLGASPVDSSAAFDVRGGDGSQQGGGGGSIVMVSYFGQSVSTGESQVAGGHGAERGQPGYFFLDGSRVAN